MRFGETVVKVLHPIATAEVLEICGFWRRVGCTLPTNSGYLTPNSVGFFFPRSRVARARLMTSLATDQLLGHKTGRVFNNEAAAVAVDAKSPDDAVKAIENSWSENRI
jgi:hypothetical protein